MKLTRKPVNPAGTLASELERIAEQFRVDHRLILVAAGLADDLQPTLDAM